jgi:hypothetical protein
MVATDPVSQVPLSIEPMVGWRVWRLTYYEGEIALHAYAQQRIWPAQQVIAATCVARHGVHKSPDDHCTCGYYAADSVENLMRSNVFHNGVGVIGAIAMWGTVIEHARGARAEFVYPARLRLVCADCLENHRLVDPVLVFEDTFGLKPKCERHAGGHPGGRPAGEVQGALLDRYGVELLPMPKLPRWTLARVAPPALKGVGHVLVGLFMVVRLVVSWLIMLWLLGIAFFVVASIISGVFGLLGRGLDAVTGKDRAAPSIVTDAPAPPSRSWLLVEPHRGGRPPVVPPATALPCGVGHGSWVELTRCFGPDMDLLGIAEHAPPRGAQHDCIGPWDAYSRGTHWWVCWIALPGARIHPWPEVENPFRARHGGVSDGDR